MVWLNREELVTYSLVVLVTVLALATMILGLDFVFGEGVLRLVDAS